MHMYANGYKQILEGLHINEDGYRAIYDDIMAYVKEV